MGLWWHGLASPPAPPSPQDAGESPLGQLCFLVIAAIIVALVWKTRTSAAQSRQRFEEAATRHASMSDEALVQLEGKILGRLYRSPDMTMAALTIAVGETHEGACLAVERLMRAHLVEIIEPEPENNAVGPSAPELIRRAEAHHQLRLTPLGSARFYDLTTKGQIKVNGDIIKAEAGAVVNNRATVVNSFNTFAERYDPALAEALVRLEQTVADAKSVEASELLGTCQSW